jgi:hypothetical protein
MSACESAPLEANRIHAVDAGAVAHGLGERQGVARHHGVPANERVLAHPAELVHAGVGADRGAILDGHVTAERRALPKMQ